MKKILSIFLFLMFVFCLKSYALTFEEGYSESSRTPVVVLVYAQWADGYQELLQEYRSIQNSKLSQNFNFVELDIASKDARFYNSKFDIYTNLPYVLMLREGGKIARFIHKDCVLDSACMEAKLRSFIQ